MLTPRCHRFHVRTVKTPLLTDRETSQDTCAEGLRGPPETLVLQAIADPATATAGCQQVRDLLLNSNQAAFLRPLTGDATIFKELSADLQREEGGMRTTGWA